MMMLDEQLAAESLMMKSVWKGEEGAVTNRKENQYFDNRPWLFCVKEVMDSRFDDEEDEDTEDEVAEREDKEVKVKNGGRCSWWQEKEEKDDEDEDEIARWGQGISAMEQEREGQQEKRFWDVIKLSWLRFEHHDLNHSSEKNDDDETRREKRK